MGNNLSPAQLNESSQALAANFERKAGVRSHGNNTNACTRLTVVGIRCSKMEPASMFGAKVMGKARHGGSGGKVFLEESHVSMPGG